MKHFKTLLAISTAITLAACASTPEPEPEPVVITAPPVQTCIPVASLTKVVIPAVTKKFIAITEIENPPYEPIQRKEEIVRTITPAQTYYVDETGAQVTDICDAQETPETMGQ